MNPTYDEATEMHVTPDGCRYDNPQEAQYGSCLTEDGYDFIKAGAME